jgi:hypothetical protein
MYHEGREQTQEASRPMIELGSAPKPSLGKVSFVVLARETRCEDLPETWRMGRRAPQRERKASGHEDRFLNSEIQHTGESTARTKHIAEIRYRKWKNKVGAEDTGSFYWS